MVLNILILGVSVATAFTTDLCEWDQIGIDVYVTHCKYQLLSYLPPWFSNACAVTIAQKFTNNMNIFYKSR